MIWSDGFQFLVLLAGMILAVPIGMTAVGDGDPAAGWERIASLPDTLFQWSTPAWPWYLAAGQLVWIFAIPVQPHLVTRFLTARDERAILIALPICLTIGLLIYASTVPVGLLGRLTQPEIEAEGYYYVELARTHLGPWLGAFALAGISAAALSTCSTVLIVNRATPVTRAVSEVAGARRQRETGAARCAAGRACRGPDRLRHRPTTSFWAYSGWSSCRHR